MVAVASGDITVTAIAYTLAMPSVTLTPSKHAELIAPFRSERVWEDASELMDDAVKRIRVAGDTHGDEFSLKVALQEAERNQCDVLVQVGDFWLQDSSWDRFNVHDAMAMLIAKQSPIPVVVVDGNHEVWPTLAPLLKSPDALAALKSGKPLHLGGSRWWALRGSVWRWSGLTFGALGGAVSPDKFISSTRGYRWPDEAPTPEDCERLLANTPEGGLDVLLTHDAPAQVTGLRGGMSYIPPEIEAELRETRLMLADVVEQTHPRALFHGHWHERNHEWISEGTEVFGLNNNFRRGFLAMAELRPEWSASYVQ